MASLNSALYRKKSGGTMSRFLGTSHHADEAQASLSADHPAVVNGTTLFPKSVKAPAESPQLLVSGVNNAKTGDRIVKGPWAGCKIFTLSLVERETCPRSCATWQTCLTPEARILTDDLRWIPLGTVEVGQKIAAFDEFAVEGKSRMTRLATVEKVGPVLGSNGHQYRIAPPPSQSPHRRMDMGLHHTALDWTPPSGATSKGCADIPSSGSLAPSQHSLLSGCLGPRSSFSKIALSASPTRALQNGLAPMFQNGGQS